MLKASEKEKQLRCLSVVLCSHGWRLDVTLVVSSACLISSSILCGNYQAGTCNYLSLGSAHARATFTLREIS